MRENLDTAVYAEFPAHRAVLAHGKAYVSKKFEKGRNLFWESGSKFVWVGTETRNGTGGGRQPMWKVGGPCCWQDELVGQGAWEKYMRHDWLLLCSSVILKFETVVSRSRVSCTARGHGLALHTQDDVRALSTRSCVKTFSSAVQYCLLFYVVDGWRFASGV